MNKYLQRSGNRVIVIRTCAIAIMVIWSSFSGYSAQEPTQLKVTAHLVECDTTTYQTNEKLFGQVAESGDWKSINELKAIELLTAPSVTVALGKGATIEIAREFRFPVDYEKQVNGVLAPTDFQIVPCGIIFEFKSIYLGNDKVALIGKMTYREFVGFTKEDKLPSFKTRELYLSRTFSNGQQVLIAMPNSPEMDFMWKSKIEPDDKTILFYLNVNLEDIQGIKITTR